MAFVALGLCGMSKGHGQTARREARLGRERGRPSWEARGGWECRVGKNPARKGLQKQSSAKAPEPGEGLWDAALPSFLVAGILAGRRGRKVDRPMCLHHRGDPALEVRVEGEGCSGQDPRSPRKVDWGVPAEKVLSGGSQAEGPTRA